MSLGSRLQGPLKIGQEVGDGLEAGQQRAAFLGSEPALDFLLAGDDRRVVAAAEVAADLTVGRTRVFRARYMAIMRG